MSSPLADLRPVPAAEVATAVRRAGRSNPLLGIPIDPHAAGDAAAVLCTPATGAIPAARLVDAVGGWAGAGERRVAASLVVLGYASRLLGPAVATLLADGVLLDLRPDRVRYTFTPQSGLRLTWVTPGGWRAAPAVLREAWCQHLVDDHLQAVIATVRGVVPVAAGLLWGNVASSLIGAVRAAAAQRAAPAAACHDIAVRLLEHGPLAGTGWLYTDGDDLGFVRRSCCLYYRLDATTCADCPFTAVPGLARGPDRRHATRAGREHGSPGCRS